MHERHQQYLAHLSRRADDAVARHGLQGVRAEVVLVLDVSKSMYSMYKSNMVAELATRLLALSLEFDDDGIIPAYAFGDTCRHLGDLTVKDFAGWVEREVIRTGNDFQNGCMYAPAIHQVCSYFFPEDWHRPTTEVRVGRIFKRKATVYPTLSAPRVSPVYALFVTSGDCQDKVAATDAVRRSSRLPIFWQFIGLQSGKGEPTRFKFLEKLDTLGNTHVDNAGFFEVSDTRNDALLFEGLCKEFPSYLALPKVTEMLAPAEAGGLSTKGMREAQLSHSADTASRMPAFDPEAGPPGSQLDQVMRERRAAAAARAMSKRSEKSQVALAARNELVEPTASLPSQTSRTLKAASANRAAALMSEARRAARESGTGTRSAVSAPAAAPAPSEAAARRARRNQLETHSQPLPESIEEAQAQLARQVERTLIRSAAGDEGEGEGADEGDPNEAMRWDESTRSVSAVTQDESTRSVMAISQEDLTRTTMATVEPDDEEQAETEAQSALQRLQEIRARRANRGG